MSDILVIGGGFAGVWSAAAAARVRERTGADLSVTLMAPGDDLVIRPRLYEAAPQGMRVPLEQVLGPVGVPRVAATVTGIDTAAHRVTAVDRTGQLCTFAYQRLVLASGSQLRRPQVPGAQYLHNVDTLGAAVALEAHLGQLREAPGRFTAVVVGAGFTGLEVATELVGRLMTRAAQAGGGERVPHVVLVDQADVVGPDLGPGPRPVITAALDELGVEVRLGQHVASVTADSVLFSDGTQLAAQTVVWTAGIEASPLTQAVPARRDRLGRLHVNQELRVPEVPTVFAAGDTAAAVAEDDHTVMPSCQHATPLGKYAGHNAAADLLGLPTVAFDPDPYVTCLDLGRAGAVLTAGWQREVQATGEQAKQRKQTINRQWIYPPLDDRAEILRRADYQVGTRRRMSDTESSMAG
jgi:NADH:ubiquinone reductase (H+-translocating)